MYQNLLPSPCRWLTLGFRPNLRSWGEGSSGMPLVVPNFEHHQQYFRASAWISFASFFWQRIEGMRSNKFQSSLSAISFCFVFSGTVSRWKVPLSVMGRSSQRIGTHHHYPSEIIQFRTGLLFLLGLTISGHLRYTSSHKSSNLWGDHQQSTWKKGTQLMTVP